MKDLFSNYASQYAAFRPAYPESLYQFILKHVSKRDAAWDCACGNGQVARDIAPHFKNVFATDISQKQLDSAHRASNIQYSIAPAEHTMFPDKTFDLIIVAQAIHWFRIPDFFKEVRRTGKDGCIIAYWGYALFRIDAKIDKLVDDFYINVIGPFWDPERKLIDEHYKSIEFPFERLPVADFDFSFDWSLQELEGYLTTWSAVQKFINERRTNPVKDLIARLESHWSGNQRRRVRFPLFVTMGRM